MPDEDFLIQRYTYAVVMNGNLEQIQRLKKLIADEDFRVIFQKTSLAELRIIEGTRSDDQTTCA
jgi:hypothetical protein